MVFVTNRQTPIQIHIDHKLLNITMMKASCPSGMVIGMGHQQQQAGREARNGDKHGFRYIAQCTAPPHIQMQIRNLDS